MLFAQKMTKSVESSSIYTLKNIFNFFQKNAKRLQLTHNEVVISTPTLPHPLLHS